LFHALIPLAEIIPVDGKFQGPESKNELASNLPVIKNGKKIDRFVPILLIGFAPKVGSWWLSPPKCNVHGEKSHFKVQGRI
jgi:hypothetical protein